MKLQYAKKLFLIKFYMHPVNEHIKHSNICMYNIYNIIVYILLDS